ncbi:hypothetical protein JTB14_034326 [Gonioctena quinquepunctata]|nr:hypothetical protein JTB14_034326 [Gonioctena quinquepunctata]
MDKQIQLGGLKESTTKPVSSSVSIKSKKSSKLLSALVRRTRNKSKFQEKHVKTVDTASQNVSSIPSSSSVGIRTEEVELIVENYERKLQSIGDEFNGESVAKESKFVATTDSEHSIQSGMKIKHQFFRKFIKRQTTNDCDKKTIRATQSENTNDTPKSGKSWEHSQLGDHNSVEENVQEEGESKTISIPTANTTFSPPVINVTLANGLHAVQEISIRLQENGDYLIEILKKYIGDTKFSEKLVDILTQHSKLHLEAERKNNALAYDMWLYQLEIGRKQERIFQETLNSFVRQNRQLQVDYEILSRKHEKLVKIIQSFHELGMKHKRINECKGQINQMMSNNENLQNRMEAFNLDQLLCDSASQLQRLTILLHRSRTNHELELAALHQTQRNNIQNIRDASEAGESLMEDLEDLKKQLKEIPLRINWSELKVRSSITTKWHWRYLCYIMETIIFNNVYLNGND